ncbi:MAG: hypothetical protein A2268_15755 [Candidatus Raymondbacteria bacterium RifOxyA12_full_50_37]|uniref:AAA domain-containing protein n=1 Tax=Candidatus Raymondbacteria bacterium RIFOXYD12_FULL_49_13 TaxID=1817890 RepID=A0A1F7FJA1_UNCRA|nr:MAG: hypothetical protein A2268_15755 [Candidatus Raymondbacteria bacterium RifOxyA12_full_50_37]OGJ87696.1 MAG: hypothetical protein A2248_07460 [Candidatus Raymondbacteria bacterium RIFOXYA2_FULL_49_16]OGJ96499.1 MAG: hypothetical protein A2453_00080 [Candidatus Raymondbacteria bacterium RIFOXYC2_FULL_50_21]OGK06795.1 MAG: hypothetical protein A2519_01010 [Candidatus Raymondbacteria bacterium RIFOXYD12_FULL_49_13]OGP41579.1 MAG: hypothetical protein A2324_09470 [Candidatus Raymondbacteria 
MSYIIAVTGKGGVGKTTISSLIISRLVAAGKTPVLAVDADPNSCLDAALGVSITKTVGSAREETKKAAGSGAVQGVSKQQMLEMKIEESLVESDGFDLIAMGRPEGPGCYCYANNVLRSVIKAIADNYPFVVIDNEAGLENLSRRIVQKVDLLVMVSDASARGLDTVTRLHGLTHEMEIEYKKLAVVVNRSQSGVTPQAAERVKEVTQADLLMCIANDPEVAGLSEAGESVNKLSGQNQTVQCIDTLLTHIPGEST